MTDISEISNKLKNKYSRNELLNIFEELHLYPNSTQKFPCISHIHHPITGKCDCGHKIKINTIIHLEI